MTTRQHWRIRLTAVAETDFQNILRWTSEHFGERQAHVYADTLTAAIEALTEGSHIAESRERNDIGEGIHGASRRSERTTGPPFRALSC